jgi:hypothetical protein
LIVQFLADTFFRVSAPFDAGHGIVVNYKSTISAGIFCDVGENFYVLPALGTNFDFDCGSAFYTDGAGARF